MNKKITIKNLNKIYTTFEKEEGLKGSIKSLFRKKVIQKIAIKNFDLEIEQGEFIGLIGQNGAGKTTLIKMLTGIIHPSEGEISVFDFKPYELQDDFKKIYSVVMGQKSQVWWDLPAVDSFLLNKELYNIPDKQYKETFDFLVKLLNVEKLLKIQVRNLSLGERMKMELILALLHNPSILFLDEPTIGLDVIAQKQIRQFLKEINKKKGITIILTSHYMEDIKYLCDRAIVVRNGSKVYDGSLESIINSYQIYKTITITFENIPKEKFELEVLWIERQDFKWVFKVKKEEAKSAIKVIMDNYDIEDISIEDEEISEIIEKIYTAREV